MLSLFRRLFLRKTTGYVSPIDRFQAEWDATHPKSASQLAEIKKYQRIYALRDKAEKVEEKKK